MFCLKQGLIVCLSVPLFFNTLAVKAEFDLFAVPLASGLIGGYVELSEQGSKKEALREAVIMMLGTAAIYWGLKWICRTSNPCWNKPNAYHYTLEEIAPPEPEKFEVPATKE